MGGHKHTQRQGREIQTQTQTHTRTHTRRLCARTGRLWCLAALRSIIRPARPTTIVNRLGLYCPIHDPVLKHPAPATTVAARRGIHRKVKPRAYGTFVTCPLARCQIRTVCARASLGIAFLRIFGMPLKCLSIWSYRPTAVIRGACRPDREEACCN